MHQFMTHVFIGVMELQKSLDRYKCKLMKDGDPILDQNPDGSQVVSIRC